MIEAKSAPVRPRVLRPPSTTPLLLDEEILSLVEADARGSIALVGACGSGKTTALRHLASVLPRSCRVTLLDEPHLSQLADLPDGLVIYTARMEILADPLASYLLTPWNRDDLIEYLLARHRPRCAAVMRRVELRDHLLLSGLPELWRIALDRLASEPAIPDVRRALHRHLKDHLTDTDLLERARSVCLNVDLAPELSLANALTEIVRPGFLDSLIRLLRHPPMRLLLASERVAADLHGESNCDYLAKRLPRDLVEAAGPLVAEDTRALVHLQSLLAGPSWSHAMVASLLHAAGKSEHLRERCPKQLAGAYLDNVVLPRFDLNEANLFEASLTGADLRGGDLTHSVLNKSNLAHARLTGANLRGCAAGEADLHGGDLTNVRGESATFVAANLEQANFCRAQLAGARFTDSNLTEAVFHEAVLLGANFTRSILTGADFSGANLTRAVLSGQRFCEAHWQGARFTEAELEACDLEYLNLAAADFENANLHRALLTGSTLFGGNFRGACLREAGLADIEWENADLREADLCGASFHLGSTRGGLVGSTIPCEGSKTGFYTDDYDEQNYKAPEEIRKANLCGADLRGAILEDVDFYLVDLRGATFDEKYADHLRRCGAILESRN